MSNKPEDRSYWDSKWDSGDILFNQPAPNRFLTKHFGKHVPKPTTVFVPLCGKSVDMEWLLEQGHKVVGVESYAAACEAFFEERGLAFEKSRSGPFTVFTSAQCTLLSGDFFDLKPEHLRGAAVAYDRAALVALPPEVRRRYFAHNVELLGPSAKFFLITCEYVQSEVTPPPFSVPEPEVRNLAHGFTTIQTVAVETSHPKDLKNPKFQQVSAYSEKVYWLAR